MHFIFNQKKMHNFLLNYKSILESWFPFGSPGDKLLNNQKLNALAIKNGKIPE